MVTWACVLQVRGRSSGNTQLCYSEYSSDTETDWWGVVTEFEFLIKPHANS